MIEVFGHKYGPTPDDMGIFNIGCNPLDVICTIGPMIMGLLPPGGYAIQRLSGSTGPLHVKWKSSVSTVWTECDWMFDHNPKYADANFYIDFTRAHRLSLASGSPMKVKLMRYIRGSE